MVDYNTPLPLWTLAELHEAAQGCTELSCMYHGAINAELWRRETGEQES